MNFLDNFTDKVCKRTREQQIDLQIHKNIVQKMGITILKCDEIGCNNFCWTNNKRYLQQDPVYKENLGKIKQCFNCKKKYCSMHIPNNNVQHFRECVIDCYFENLCNNCSIPR